MTNKQKWRIGGAALVLVLVVAAITVVVVRQGSKNDNSVTTAAPAADTWFGSQMVSACPGLEQWTKAGTSSYSALLKGTTDWNAAKATLAQDGTTATTVYKNLLPLATPAGKAELEYLGAYQRWMSAGLAQTQSVANYLELRQRLASPRQKAAYAQLTQKAATCSKT